MVKINKIRQNAKSKLNTLMDNSVTKNKIGKIKTKMIKTALNHVKLNVNSDDLDLTVNSSRINFVVSKNKHAKIGNGSTSNSKSITPAQNNVNKSFSKLFRQSKAQTRKKQNTEKPDLNKIPENVDKKLTSNVLPVPQLQSNKITHFTVKPGKTAKKTSSVTPKADQPSQMKETDFTNGLPKQQASSAVIPKAKRKTYENGWTVEDFGETGDIENESSDSDCDTYIDRFFNDDDSNQEQETKVKILSGQASKPKKCMLLLHHSPQPSENSDDSSSETSQPNFVKLKKKKPDILEEQSSSEMVRYVAAENEDDEMTSDSEYDPSWNSTSDDQYEGMDDNEFIEYSAEEVESVSIESSAEYESTDSNYTESADDGFSDECMSDEDTYDSEDDEDYVPGINDDLYISRGDAQIYDVFDNNISFNSDETVQIFEITGTETQATSDNESCPDLLPIIPSKDAAPITPTVNFYSSVVDEILKDSENEDLNSEENDDDFINNLCSFQTESFSMDTSAAIESNEEEDKQSNGKSKFYNSSVSPHLVLLHLKEIIYFHGNFTVTLVHGSAKSFGYEFKVNKPIEFYSPSCDSLLYLMPVDSGKSGKLNIKVLEEYFDQDIIKEIVRDISNANGEAIMLLDYYESKRVESIRLFMRDEIFPLTKERHTARPFHLSEIRLKTNFIVSDSLHYSGYRKMETETAWNTIPMHPDSKLMVIGGKSVGKSSLIKYLINSNINRMKKILFIDFDIGQPEIYIPQTISATVIDFPILGSGCFHKVVPKKVLLFGDIAVTSEQIKYIHACNTLIQYCTSNEELSAMPWVINTMGYNKGLGDEIIAAYLKTIKPTDVVQINSPRNADNFNQLFTPEFTNQFQFNMFTQEFKDNATVCTHNLIAIEAYSKMYERNVKGLLSAKDKRLLMILAHLGDILEVSGAKWLTDAEVKKINLNDLHIFTSYSLDKFGCTASLLKSVLDMTFVYLCNKNNDTSTDTTADCIGVGLVRHIDTETGTLYLITAVSDDDLELVNALALTNITIAKAILERQSVLVGGNIKSIGLSDNFIGTRQVQPQTYRPDTTTNTRSNYVKE